MKYKNYYLLLVLMAFSLFSCDLSAEKIQPVNKKATVEAKQLLEFLYSLKGKYTLTGQHNFVSGFERYDDAVYNLTGKHSVVWGADFSFMAQGDNVRKFQHCGPMNLTVPWDSCTFNGRTMDDLRQSLVDEAIRQYKEGRIITLMWHCCYPSNGNDCNGDDIWRWAENLPSDEEWLELTTDGTALNTAWKEQMNTVVIYLKKLQDAKVPVLWRPYHEMNGMWFWWCNKPGAEGFQKLWKQTYHYLTDTCKLNNLLWVWDTNAPRDIPGDEAGPYADYFPGVEYVDVLAADVYHRDFKQSHHDELLVLGKGKLIALGEVGALPTIEQYEAQPDWSWFMTWGYFVNNRDNRDVVKEIYNHPRSITLDKISLTNKGYSLKPALQK